MSTVSGVSHNALQYVQPKSQTKPTNQLPVLQPQVEPAAASKDKAVIKEGSVGTKFDAFA